MHGDQQEQDDDDGQLDALMSTWLSAPRSGVGVAGDGVPGGLALGRAAPGHAVDERGRGHAEGDERQLQPVEERPADRASGRRVVERDDQRHHDRDQQQPVPRAAVAASRRDLARWPDRPAASLRWTSLPPSPGATPGVSRPVARPEPRRTPRARSTGRCAVAETATSTRPDRSRCEQRPPRPATRATRWRSVPRRRAPGHSTRSIPTRGGASGRWSGRRRRRPRAAASGSEPPLPPQTATRRTMPLRDRPPPAPRRPSPAAPRRPARRTRAASSRSVQLARPGRVRPAGRRPPAPAARRPAARGRRPARR